MNRMNRMNRKPQEVEEVDELNKLSAAELQTQLQIAKGRMGRSVTVKTRCRR